MHNSHTGQRSNLASMVMVVFNKRGDGAAVLAAVVALSQAAASAFGTFPPHVQNGMPVTVHPASSFSMVTVAVVAN